MKNILFPAICVALLSFTVPVQAEEFQCNISSTGAADCESYYEVKYACPFPEDLNEKRTAELETGKASFPDFCTTCGAESEIPKNCRAIRISKSQSVVGSSEKSVASEASEVVDMTIAGLTTIQESTILQNAYQGFKIAVVRVWEWFKVASRGESFEIESHSTPVAGVRG